MATSNSTDFNLTTNQIIEEAFREIGVKTTGRALTSEEVDDAKRSLNIMIKSWESNGLYLWKETEGTLFLTAGQASYRLDASTANATESFNETTLSANEGSGETTISVTSTNNMAVNDIVLIKQDNNTLHASTINSIGVGTIDIADATTNDATSGNKVFFFTTKIDRPQRISSCRLRQGSSNTDIVVREISRQTYFDLSNKTSQGKPSKYFYDKQRAFGDLYLWSTPSDVDDTIKFTFARSFQDFDTATDDPDFPTEWLNPIIMNLAVILGRQYGIGRERLAEIKISAEISKAELEDWDREPTSIYFAPSYDTQINS